MESELKKFVAAGRGTATLYVPTPLSRLQLSRRTGRDACRGPYWRLLVGEAASRVPGTASWREDQPPNEGSAFSGLRWPLHGVGLSSCQGSSDPDRAVIVYE
jgi:hypothetical protein